VKRTVFFFDKRSKKLLFIGLGTVRPARLPSEIIKSLFASFSSEKEESFFFCLADNVQERTS